MPRAAIPPTMPPAMAPACEDDVEVLPELAAAEEGVMTLVMILVEVKVEPVETALPEEAKVEFAKDVMLEESDVKAKLEEGALPEGPEVKAEPEEEPLPKARMAPTALKRRATDELEESIDTKRPRVSLPRIEALDIPLEAFRAYTEGRARETQGFEGRLLQGIDGPEANMLLPIVRPAIGEPRVVGCA